MKLKTDDKREHQVVFSNAPGVTVLNPAAAARWRPVEKNSAGGSSWGYIWGKHGAILAHWKAINTYVRSRNEIQAEP